MIPDFWNHHEFSQALKWNDAEVAHPHRITREHAMDEAIKAVQNPEWQTLQPLRPGRENNRPLALGFEPLHQQRNILRPIFAVRIHHDHGAARPIRIYIDQSGRDRALMPQIAPQLEHVHGSHCSKALLAERHRPRLT